MHAARRFATPLAVLLLAIGGLTACGDHSSDDMTASQSAYNQSDVAFVQSMIPHHEEALEMAVLARARAADPKVKQLAAQIEAAQAPEIAAMKAWLQQWGRTPVLPSSMPGMDMSAGAPGIMSKGEMDTLKAAHGGAFDRMFLAMMVQHHDGAIAMAATEVASGKFPAALDLARSIQRTQTAQVVRMRKLASAYAKA